ncbi:MAG: hypothetical protein HDQ91_05030 [Desulfovibrio sp.]|nr:hypothetical protein [Desulfovibrio sp.]
MSDPNVMFLKFEFENTRGLELLSDFHNDVPIRHEIHQAIGSAIKRTGTYVNKHIARLIMDESYLKAGYIKKNLRLSVKGSHYDNYIFAIIRASGDPIPAHKFKLVPNRVTTRKQMQSKSWPAPSYKIGPKDKLRSGIEPGYSKPWIGLTSEGKKAMYHRQNGSSHRSYVVGPRINYFASFDRIFFHAFDGAQEVFEKRLEHEIDYRLKLS